MKTCLLLPPLPHKNVCHPRWMYLSRNGLFRQFTLERTTIQKRKMFFFILSFFVTYGAGLQKRLSAGWLCAMIRRAIGKSGSECIISPKLDRALGKKSIFQKESFKTIFPSSPSQDGGSHKDGMMFGQNTFLLHRL